MVSEINCSHVICTEIDGWHRNYAEMNTIWVVTLSDGTIVYQDDDRPGLTTNSAWERLGNYCAINDVYIVKMEIKFRSNHVLVGESTEEEPIEGFYFRKSILASTDGQNWHFYLAGVLKDGILTVRKWPVPDLSRYMEEERDLSEAGISLIRKPDEAEIQE